MQDLGIAKENVKRMAEGVNLCILGKNFDDNSNFEKAIYNYKKALDIFKETGFRDGEGSALSHLGSTYYKMGNFKEAIDYHKLHLNIAKDLRDRAEEGNAYQNLGSAFYSLGNFQQTIEYHMQHLCIAKELRDINGEGIANWNLGLVYFKMRYFKQALDCFKKHLNIVKERGNALQEGKAYCKLGSVLLCVGDFKQASQYHSLELSIAKKVGDRAWEGRAYCNLGNAQVCLNDNERAKDYLELSLSIAKEVGNRSGEGKVLLNLGKVYYNMVDFVKAKHCMEQHLTIVKEVGDRDAEGMAYGNLGNAYCGMGDFKQALSNHEKYLSIAKETNDLLGLALANMSLGFDYSMSGSLLQAVDCYRSSTEHFNELRGRLLSEDRWKINFRDQSRYSYTSLWRTLLKVGDIDEALYAAEQGRAQALLDNLKEQYGVDAQPSSNVAPKDIVSFVFQSVSPQTVFIALDMNTISFWLLSKSGEVHFRQQIIKGGSADSLMTATLKEIGAGVDVTCEDRSLDNLRGDISGSVKPAIRNTVSQFTNSSMNSLQSLHDVLISPIADLLQGDELIFVPDGPFCLAPYCALSDSIRIRTFPSLFALKIIAGAPDDFHSISGALLVGDPCLKEITDKEGQPKFLQLHYAKEEVDMIGKLLQSVPLTGRYATKAEVLKRMKTAALVHIAAHGCQDTGEIALAPSPDRTSQIPREEDFILTMSDVQELCLQARLVVLSCCHSGRGEVKPEGVVGIARAFLCAGARSVLVSLWAIDDEATFMFMRSFYRGLVNGKRTSVALHGAMKSLQVSKEYCHVRDWAPFVLIGDDVMFEFGDQRFLENSEST